MDTSGWEGYPHILRRFGIKYHSICYSPTRYRVNRFLHVPLYTTISRVQSSAYLLVHDQKDLVTFIDSSFCGKIPWSIKYNQSRNTAWILFLPDGVICVMLNHFCVVETRAGNVDRPRVNARWLFFISKSKYYVGVEALRGPWSIVHWRKSFSISFEDSTHAMGDTRACL